MSLNRFLTVLTVLMAASLLPFSAQARLAELVSDQIAAEVQDLVMNDLIAMNQEQLEDGQPAPDNDGPILGMPTVDQMLSDRFLNVWMNPTYWSTWVQEALINGNVQIPSPTDIAKPEAWTPNVHVANGEYISPLPEALQDTSQLTYEWDGATKTVEDFMNTTETDMVNFVVNGALVDELYNNGYSAEVRHQPWSVTKTFIAATVGIAFDEGHIDSLQDPIEKYIPELVGTAWETVTVENILQMESGVHWDEDTPVLAQNTQVEQWVQVMLDYYTQGQLGQTRNEFLKALPKVYEQGTEFRYNSGNTQVLAWMLELIYDKPYNEIISEKIWIPMGAQGDAMMIADREGGVLASQGLYARLHDFSRFGEVMRNGGVNSDGRRVLPDYWVEAMTQMTEVSNGRYAYQTWSSTAGEGAYKASGFQGQKITVVPKKCMTAVRMSHSFGLDYRDGDIQDPDAYGFSTNFSADEWASMVKQVAEQIAECDDSGKAVEDGGAGGSEAANGNGGGGAVNAMALLLTLLLMVFGRRLRARPLS
jgi:CubicO group peptidase (beta-lactamase class C family)